MVLLIAGRLLERLALLVVDLAVAVSRHHWTRLAVVGVLQLIVRLVLLGGGLVVGQAEVLVVVLLLSALRRLLGARVDHLLRGVGLRVAHSVEGSLYGDS